MLADVDALVRFEEINIERFEDPGENVVWQGHCVVLVEAALERTSKCMACAWQLVTVYSINLCSYSRT